MTGDRGQPASIHATQALLDGVIAGPVRVRVHEGRLVEVDHEEDTTAGPQDVVLRDGVLTPGLIDVQLNGAFGVDVADSDPSDWTTLLAALARRGVTAVQPTIITAPLDQMTGACGRVLAASRTHADQPVARVLGAHLEGPFLSPARAGAHPAEQMVDPTPQALDRLLGDEHTRDVLRTVTLAPERPHGLAAVRRLVEAGVVVSVGHSDATADQVWAAADAGATMTTHVFNAQRPLGHREPGVPGAVLTDPRFFVGTILDGRHVHPSVVGLVLAAASGRVVGVSDAIVTAGLPRGASLTFGGHAVENDERGLGRRPDGTIAGATTLLDEGVRRMIGAGLDPAAVLSSCTEVPARSLGRDDLGRLRVGARADLVWWDADWHPRRVWIAGSVVAG
jgi:N-acetylglucosamine-6-phosphate deacetylase